MLGLLYKMVIKKNIIVPLYLEGKKLILYLHKTKKSNDCFKGTLKTRYNSKQPQ